MCCSYFSGSVIRSRCCYLFRAGCVLKLVYVGSFVPAVVFLLRCACFFASFFRVSFVPAVVLYILLGVF